MRTQTRTVDVASLFVALAAIIGTLFVIGCATPYVANVPQNYTVGGNVSGLAGTGLVLQDNNANNLQVLANGSFTFAGTLASGSFTFAGTLASGSFTFAGTLASGSGYSVTVFSQPVNLSQTCTVTPNTGSGTVTGNINTVAVTCVTDTFTVGGTVSGLAGGGLVLKNNNGNNLAVSATLPGAFSAPFTFTTAIASGAGYAVTVGTPATNPTQTCLVTNGSGTVTTGAINSVAVACTPTTSALVVPDDHNDRVLVYNAPFSTGQGANVVLGQANFTTATPGTSASTMNHPSAVAMDSSGNVYVSENLNCRVMQFRPPFSNGMNASVVFGQPDFVTANCAAATSANSLGSATGLDQVFGVAVDSSGNLWVADSGSDRVLEYRPPFSTGMAATLAIGQINLVSGSANQGNPVLTASGLFDPGYPSFDRSGNLWIADSENNRLLEFSPPFSTGMAASVVIGQADFTHNAANQGGAVGPNALFLEEGIAFDSSGNLWVPDGLNNRVLEFQPPFTTNMNASLVLGQADFAHNAANQGLAAPTNATLSFPHQVAFDIDGRLFVSDSSNNRTVVFAPPFSTGMNASLVIGQANFTGAAAAATATGQNFAAGETPVPPLY